MDDLSKVMELVNGLRELGVTELDGDNMGIKLQQKGQAEVLLAMIHSEVKALRTMIESINTSEHPLWKK